MCKRHIKIFIPILIGGIILALSQGNLSFFHKKTFTKEGDLYLPEVKYLKFISLGHEGLMADFILAKALTYYGSHYFERKNFRYKHLKKLFVAALEMDPMNKDAFLLASNILSNISIQDSIEILRLGMGYHPDYWKFPEMIAFRFFFNLNNSYQAARYYEIASRLPGHPPYVSSLSEKFYRESGRYKEALRVLYNFYSTTTDRRLKESFKISIESIQEKIKNRDFQLKASVLKVLNIATIEFQPDPYNMQFQSLNPVETLHILGITRYNPNSSNIKKKLAALFQQEFARYMLTGKQIKISFQRDPKGLLQRDKKNRLQGTVTLKYDKSYRQAVLQSGVMTDIDQFPPAPQDLNLKKVFQHTGKVVSLRFKVQRVEIKKDSIYLHAASDYRNRFSAVVPASYINNFKKNDSPPVEYFKQLTGKHIIASGFAGIGNHRVEIKIYYPLQLQN